jgi:protein-S-isoprenylcysteine O-methyltransferase Ste14
VLIFIVLFHYLSILYVHLLCGRTKAERKKTQKKLPVIWVKDWVWTPLMFVFFFTYLIFFSANFWLPFTFPVNQLIMSIGISQMVIGFYLKFWAYHTLGHNWSPGANLFDDQRLVTNGPYSIFRHGVYLSYLLTFIGYGFFSGNLIAIILSIIYYALNILRSLSEEKMLLEKFGQEYRNYQISTRQNKAAIIIFFIVALCPLLGGIDELVYLATGKLFILEQSYKLWLQLIR